MEYVIQHNVIYKGENLIMGNSKGKKLTKKLYKLYLSVLSILILPALGYIIIQIISLNRETSGIEDIKQSVKEINDGLNGKSGLYTRMAIVEKELGIDVSTINISNNEFYSFVEEFNNEYRTIKPGKQLLKSKTVIGIDLNGDECIAEDYINKTVLLTYKDNTDEEDAVEVYFLGQYNENYHWNGFCVTNVYYSEGELAGKLHEICESDFDDGERLNFKSIHYNIQEDDWLYSNREIKNNVNIGINKHFLFNYNKSKNFTSSNVKTSDIMYVDSFMENVNAILTKYYSGNTSNHYFNDISGNAYRTTYFEDGTVESLYIGNFVDGYPNDDTGNAWMIYYSEDIANYKYSKGIFDNDRYVGNDEPTAISIDEINKIISNYNFECDLKWKK